MLLKGPMTYALVQYTVRFIFLLKTSPTKAVAAAVPVCRCHTRHSSSSSHTSPPPACLAPPPSQPQCQRHTRPHVHTRVFGWGWSGGAGRAAGRAGGRRCRAHGRRRAETAACQCTCRAAGAGATPVQGWSNVMLFSFCCETSMRDPAAGRKTTHQLRPLWPTTQCTCCPLNLCTRCALFATSRPNQLIVCVECVHRAQRSGGSSWWGA